MTNIIPPNSVIGILGSGQLGRMLAMEARRTGYRVHTFSPEADTPTGQLADLEVCAAYTDFEAVEEFARNVDVITFEFENVPLECVNHAEKFALVRPRGEVLHIAQNRLREKMFLQTNGFPVTPFRHVKNLEELRPAMEELGLPAVLKTAGFGYDGKGQVKIHAVAEAAAAFRKIGGQEAVLEAFVKFEKEISVVAAQDSERNFAHFGVIENDHSNHILDVSFAPAFVSPEIAREAIEITQGILRKLEVVGVMCVEFFLTETGKLLVNEIAPRPHNSGHLTLEACVTSQFEQQLRAVCGLPLGSTDFLKPSAMANLLGDLWQHGEPDWAAALRFPDLKLHLYGKATARTGRKMGHLTALAATVEEALETVRQAREDLRIPAFRVDET